MDGSITEVMVVAPRFSAPSAGSGSRAMVWPSVRRKVKPDPLSNCCRACSALI
ncbi:hypothetical protein D3C85_1707630 [compost metagenome]